VSGWQELESEHFVLLTDSSTETATALIKRLERGRLLMLMVMWSGRTTPAGRMRVIHFAHQRDLVDQTRSGISGLVQSDAFGGRIVGTAESWDGIDMVLNHELAHRLAAHFIPRQPRWVAEGIATYLETIHTVRGADRLAVGESSQQRLDYLMRGSAITGYDKVLRMDSSYIRASDEDAYAFESQAWALVHWLINNDAAGFNRYIDLVSGGESSVKAFEQAFPSLPVGRIDAVLSAYVRNGRYKSFTTNKVPQYSGPIAVRELTAAEVHAQRAQLRRSWHGENDPAYRAELTAALQADPTHPLALELSGQGDAAASTKAHPDDARAWLLRSNRAGGDLAALEQAVRIAPEDPQVLAELAHAKAKAGAVDDGIALALRAVQFEPGRPDLLLDLAGLLTHSGRCEEASITEDRALEVMPDGVNKEYVTRTSETIARFRRECVPVAEPTLQSCDGEGPRLAAKDSVDATVSAIYEVGPDGRVGQVTVSGTTSKPVLEAVRTFVKSCKYKPAVRDGKPLARQVRDEFEFKRLQ
jgi:tetratricopeptide (TPR) repeat protein